MLPVAFLTLLAMMSAAALTVAGIGSPVAVLHLVFAVGIVPLIMAAMMHFVPVLTRTGSPHRRLRAVPHLAQGAGLLAVAAMAGQVPHDWLTVAAAIDFLLAATLTVWMTRRAARTLGQPHPGWRWYAAALGCLMLALLAVLAMAVWPAGWGVLRQLHLHLNMLGLVGMAAFGTLPVLLPTALGAPDPVAADWLRRMRLPMFLAVLATAIGAAFLPILLVIGGLLLIGLASSLLVRWMRHYSLIRLCRDGVTTSLLGATAGWCLALAGGVWHGGMGQGDYRVILAWATAFLLPLVTGALSQLLPVWRWPGPRTEARDRMRAMLATGGRLRALLFLLAGGASLVAPPGLAIGLALAGLLLFGLVLIGAMRIQRSTR